MAKAFYRDWDDDEILIITLPDRKRLILPVERPALRLVSSDVRELVQQEETARPGGVCRRTAHFLLDKARTIFGL